MPPAGPLRPGPDSAPAARATNPRAPAAPDADGPFVAAFEAMVHNNNKAASVTSPRWLLAAAFAVLGGAACHVETPGLGDSGGGGTTTASTGTMDPGGGKAPVCLPACSGNTDGCVTESEAACGDELMGTPCASDAQCGDAGAGTYCHLCKPGKGYCFAGCANEGDCQYWESCTAGRCAPRECGGGGYGFHKPCPPNFACVKNDAGAPTCARLGCETDAECGGSCVLHECQSTLGVCSCAGC